MSMTAGTGGINSDINITPLVDVVLVLLIIFMIAQPMLKRGYDSAIPKPDPTAPPPPPGAPPSFVLKLAFDPRTGTIGQINLNNETINRADLRDRVRSALLTVSNASEKVVFIDCNDDVGYNDLMQVVDDLRQAGVVTIGFSTEAIG